MAECPRSSWRSPTKITFVTFDVYGTLIDWETGISDAFEKEAEREGFTIERDEVSRCSTRSQREIEGGSYELYAEVLRRTAVEIAKQIGWPLEPSRVRLPARLGRALAPFKETNPQLRKFAKQVQDRPDLQHRRQAAGPDAAPHPARLRPRRDRSAGALLQARPGALHGVRAADRGKKGWVHIGGELLPRRRAVHQGQGAGDLGQPHKETLDSSQGSRRPRSRTCSRRPSCSAL